MQTKDLVKTMEDSLLTRRELASRWKVSIETIKRRERTRVLRPLRLEGLIIRYRMSDVVRIEQDGGSWPQDA
jgi:DNA-binding transcriptional regulator YhcF (GntR family)